VPTGHLEGEKKVKHRETSAEPASSPAENEGDEQMQVLSATTNPRGDMYEFRSIVSWALRTMPFRRQVATSYS
jgi:hypothetical protein